MTLPRRRALAPTVAALVALMVAGVLLPACSDDDGDAATSTTAPRGSTTTSEVPGHGSASSTTLATGNLDVVVPDGWSPIPLPSLGIGLGVPRGWQAAALTPEALERLAGLAGASRGFVEAARNAADSGASLYAAGVDDQGRVSDLKLFRVPLAGADAAALERAAAQAVAAAPPGAAADPAGPGGPHDLVRLRIRFTVSAGGVEAQGTQWLIAGPDAVWSLVVTNEDAAAHDPLALALADAVTFGR